MRAALARILRGFADALDPPAPAKRQHPGLATPGTVTEPVARLEITDKLPTPGAGHAWPERTPGRWGGPYV